MMDCCLLSVLLLCCLLSHSFFLLMPVPFFYLLYCSMCAALFAVLVYFCVDYYPHISFDTLYISYTIQSSCSVIQFYVLCIVCATQEIINFLLI